MKGEFKTAERRNFLLNLARNYQEIHDGNPDLRPLGVLNLIHGRGIDATQADLDEALQLVETVRPAASGFSTRKLAEYTGIALGTLKSYLFGDDAPEDFPRPHIAYKSDTSKSLYWDALDAERLKVWYQAMLRQVDDLK